jgi:hypothetical protein
MASQNPAEMKSFLLLILPLAVILLPTAARSSAPSERVDTTTLTGKIMCGYQGWFTAKGDDTNLGWVHWTKDRLQDFAPGNAKVDLWPDVSELSPKERYPTGFRHADGRRAEVFSSFEEDTVLRHFQWMQTYGIDGVFVQRFAADLLDPQVLRRNNAVLDHCLKGAKRCGRAIAVMYDLTGIDTNSMDGVREDWLELKKRMKITREDTYLRHRGKPLVAVWGVGFSDNRKYTLSECRELVQFFKDEGCAVMLGVPAYWRELKADAVSDPALHELLKLADVVSPWTVGRYRDPDGVLAHENNVLKPDLAWCAENNLDYLPVIFPGFSWHNMNGGPLDDIPRLKGAFLWSQFVSARRAGAQMIYVAMFDEVDEGTAIFKCTNDVPDAGDTRFVTYEGLPSDYYLRLTGTATRMLRGEIPFSEELPTPE